MGLLLAGAAAMALAQVQVQGDSPVEPASDGRVTLRGLMEQAAATHPTMRGARLESQAARQDIETVRRQGWPTLAVSAESKDSNAATSAILAAGEKVRITVIINGLEYALTATGTTATADPLGVAYLSFDADSLLPNGIVDGNGIDIKANSLQIDASSVLGDLRDVAGLAVGTFTVARVLAVRRYLSLSVEERRARLDVWSARFMAVMLLYGTLQSLIIAAGIPHNDQVSQVVLSCMILLSCALVSTSMPYNEQALRWYLVLALIPTALAWLWVDVAYAWAVSLCVLFAAMVFRRIGLSKLASLREAERLTRNLSRSNQMLRAGRVARTRMLMEASHDLRQPAHALTILVAQLRALPPGADSTHLAASIESCANSMADMLNEMMEFSRFDLDDYVPELSTVELGNLLEELQHQFEPAATSKGLAFSVDTRCVSVRSHPWLLRRIIHNFISNAVKYTSRGSVAVRVVEEDKGLVAVHIEDTGRGIPQAQQQRVFQEYVRLTRGAEDEPGSGIGLSFARRAARALGHEIELRSEIDAGTTVILRARKAQAHSGDTRKLVASSALQPHAFSGQRMLVIENDVRIRSGIAALLRDWGLCVNAVASFEEWERRMDAERSERPDLVLADLHLDGQLNGLEAIGRIRAAYDSPDIAGILLTGDLSEEVEASARASGVQVHYKPLRASRLQGILRGAVNRIEERAESAGQIASGG